MLALDVRRRELLPEVEGLKAQQNTASAAIAAAKQAGGDAGEAIAEMQEVARRGKALREELDGVQAELDEALAALPNPPHPTAADEDEVLYERGEIRAARARTTWSSRARGSTWRRARAWPARASPTSRATSCCSSWRSCAGCSRCCAARASSP